MFPNYSFWPVILFVAHAIIGHAAPGASLQEGDNAVQQFLPDIPSIGLGTWLSPKGKVGKAVDHALSNGYVHIDAALIYKNERKVGKGIKASKLDRNDFWVTSKLWNTDHRPKQARKAIDKSLHDLGLKYLDLYLMHWPVAFRPGTTDLDKKVSIVDTWKAMEGLVRDNKTRHIGVSNFSPADLSKILDICEICPYAHEFETHPYLQQQEFVNWHLERNIKVIAYSPLANTNPHYRSGIPAIFDDPFWKNLALVKNATVPQTVLAWGIQRGTVVIPKSIHKKYIDENLGALGISFTDEELALISAQDKKLRLNDPGKGWKVDLFEGLDDPTRRAVDSGLEYEL